MIGRLNGIVAALESDRLIVDVNGVGYEVVMTAKALAAFPVGESATIFTHLYVREEIMMLYGFPNRVDRDLFRVLLSVSGVGPKVALAVLGVMSGDALRRAVATEDVDAFVQVPGIGKRGAQKILLDLRPRLADLEADVLDAATGTDVVSVRQALETLGYSNAEIRDVLPSIDRSKPIAEQVREALREFGSRVSR